jgi:hypothetical protein
VARRRFSSTVNSSMIPRPSGTWATPRRATFSTAWPSSSSPSKRTEPERDLTRPLMVRSSVVLPAPLAPSTAVMAPGWAENDTERSALTAP